MNQMYAMGGAAMTIEKKSPLALILLAWIVVSIPAGWGVYNTAKNALKLFHSSAPAASAGHT
jgi:hypothetical protein